MTTSAQAAMMKGESATRNFTARSVTIETHNVTLECGCVIGANGAVMRMCKSDYASALRHTARIREQRMRDIIAYARKRDAIARNYYATCTFASPTPFTDDDLARHERIHGMSLRDKFRRSVILPISQR